MPEELNGQQPTVDGQQPATVPTANQNPDDESVNFDLPEDSSDRTKEAFEKLKAHNKALAEQNRQLKEATTKPDATSVFGGLTPPKMPDLELPKLDLPVIPGLSKAKVADIVDQVTDANGYIQEDALKQALRQAQEAAKAAKEEAQRARAEVNNIQESAQVREAHKDFPELDPKSTKFDPKFFEAVKNEVVSQMIRGEKDLVAAAQKVSGWYPLKRETPSPEIAKKKEEQIRQINNTGSSISQGQSGYEKSDLSDLAQKTRSGDKNALAERLKRAGF